MEPLTATTTQWTHIQKFFFRFFFAYFFVTCFPFPLDIVEFTKPIVRPYFNLRNWAVAWTGNQIFFNLYFAVIVTLIWSFVNRHRINYAKLDQWLRLYLRCYLVYYVFVYGFAKVFHVQAFDITESRLALPYGIQKPSSLFWHFLSYSEGFRQFIGWIEVAGGLLLLWRRTVTIGAIILTIALIVVVMVNFCFGIRVRYIPINLLLMAIYLLGIDRKRLVNLFFLNKPTERIAYVPLVSHTLWRPIFKVAQLIILIGLLYIAIRDNITFSGYSDTPRPLDGIYHTEYFIRGTDTIPPLQTDSLRWKRLIIDNYGIGLQFSHVQLSTDTLKYCNAIVDTIDRVIRFHFKTVDGRAKIYDSCRITYSLPDTNHLLLRGIWKNDSIKVMMKKYDLNNYLLYRTKLDWTID